MKEWVVVKGNYNDVNYSGMRRSLGPGVVVPVSGGGSSDSSSSW